MPATKVAIGLPQGEIRASSGAVQRDSDHMIKAFGNPTLQTAKGGPPAASSINCYFRLVLLRLAFLPVRREV